MKFAVAALLAALATTGACIAADFHLISPKNNACVVPGKAVWVEIKYTNTVSLISVSYTAVLVYPTFTTGKPYTETDFIERYYIFYSVIPMHSSERHDSGWHDEFNLQ